VLRSAVALSAVTGRAVRVGAIRAGRPKPGLQAQHLCAVTALARLTGARLEGAALGATTLLFAPPASPRPDLLGREHATIDIGSAGSATLVLQTLLPSLLAAPPPPPLPTGFAAAGGGGADLVTTVTVIGGTANPMAPPAAFFIEAFLPALNGALRCAAAARRGAPLVTVALDVLRHGFYPAGGGRLVLRVTHSMPSFDAPSPAPALAGATRFSLLSRGELASATAACVVAANLPLKIAEREAAVVRASRLEAALRAVKESHRVRDGSSSGACGGPSNDAALLSIHCESVPSSGPGNAVFVALRFEHVTEVVSAFGERGRAAEDVAAEAARLAEEFLVATAAPPASVHLADQLLLPLALLGGGSFRTDPHALAEGHFATNADVIHQFLGPGVVVAAPAAIAGAGGEGRGAGGRDSADTPGFGVLVEVWPEGGTSVQGAGGAGGAGGGAR
jgi:RNA 3'-terminal phosphate cyclase (ATP)